MEENIQLRMPLCSVGGPLSGCDLWVSLNIHVIRA